MNTESDLDEINKAIENALNSARFHAASIKGTSFGIRLFLGEAGYEIIKMPRNKPSLVSLEEIVEVLKFYADPANARERRIDRARIEDGRDPVVRINNISADPGYALSKLAVDGGERARSLLDRLSNKGEE